MLNYSVEILTETLASKSEIHQRPELMMAVRLDGNIKKNRRVRAKSHLDFWMEFHGNDKWRDKVNINADDVVAARMSH